jgi:NTE family protein
MLGLVLTAGGARGAYQAGVLKRIGEIPALRNSPSPFAIVAGASAGAINGTMIAAGSAGFRPATRRLAGLWGNLSVEQVFRTDVAALGQIGLRLVRDLALGGLIGGGTTHSLFDASPLRELLRENLPLGGIATAIRRGHLYAVAVSATSYHSGKAFTFIQGQPGHPIWSKSRRSSLAVRLTIDHVLASAAIPIIFPPVLVSGQGECFFGDGGLRLVTPFSPAIRLGASRVFGVGIRCPSAAEALSKTELGESRRWKEERSTLQAPPLAQICGVFLNAIFLDHLDTDLDHLERMNELIAFYEKRHHAPPLDAVTPELSEPMRVVEPLVVNPSEDLALVAQEFAHKMPRLMRYVLEGLGTPNAESADLMSYLLFDSSFTRALIDIGYRDAGKRIDEIEEFLRVPQAAKRAAARRAGTYPKLVR